MLCSHMLVSLLCLVEGSTGVIASVPVDLRRKLLIPGHNLAIVAE